MARGLTAREIEGALLTCGDTGISIHVATVDSVEDAVLETGWIFEVNVQLAILAALIDGDAGADGGDILVEDESEAVDL